MYDAVLVPTDGSDAVQPAIDHGLELAALTDATVHALFVVETAASRAISEAQWLPYEETLAEAGERAVADIEATASERDIDAVTEKVIRQTDVPVLVEQIEAE